MGWSYAVTCKSGKARDQMWSFLEEEFRPATEALGEFLAVVFSRGYPMHLCAGEHLSYDGAGGRSKIGANNGCEYERQVLQWVASKVGRRRKLGRLKAPTLYYTYDGKCVPILLASEPENHPPSHTPVVVDDIGFSRIARPWDTALPSSVSGIKNRLGDAFVRRYPRGEKMIRAELLRLDAAWAAHTT